MLAPIDLDDEARLLAKEIDHIGPHWGLTAEFVAKKAAGAHVIPKRSFGIGHLTPKPFDLLLVRPGERGNIS